jgi:hypothetical protein
MTRTAASPDDGVCDHAAPVPLTNPTALTLRLHDAEGQEGLECVGSFAMRVATGEATPESVERWARRAEALAAWLAAEWKPRGWPRRPREAPDGAETGVDSPARRR